MDEPILTDDTMRAVVSDVDAYTLRMYQQGDTQAMHKIVVELFIRMDVDANETVTNTEVLDAFDEFLQREL